MAESTEYIIFAAETLQPLSMKFIAPRYILPFLISICFSFSAYGQDLIARQVPIDRKMKSVDSLTINRIMKKASFSNYESNDLYSSWNTTRAHCYADAEIPETFKIDLRGFCMPTTSRTVTSKFGYRQAFRRMHKGVDVKVYTGDTIVSAFDGKVRIVDNEPNGYGLYVVIRHRNGLETIYGHMSRHLCKEGDVVKAGEVIGLGGNTGRSYGSHLHFETRLLGVAINPLLMFDFANQDVTGDYFVFNRNDVNNGMLAYSANAKVSRDEVLQPERRRVEDLRNSDDDDSSDEAKEVASASGKFYQVKKGDTLSGISEKIGVSIDDICEMNGIQRTTKLQRGQILRY